MTFPVAERWLSASINAPAAWAAFAYVRDLDWSLRVDCKSPFSLDVCSSPGFQACLDGGDSDRFAATARSEIAMRVLQLTASMDERNLRLRGIQVADFDASSGAERATLDALKGTLLARLRRDIDAQLQTTPGRWADQARLICANLSEPARLEVETYFGLDQELTDKQCMAGLKYAFTTLEPEVSWQNGAPTLSGNQRKIREARSARHDPDPKARARNLAVRAIDVSLALMTASNRIKGLDSDDIELLETVRRRLFDCVGKHGCWSLIDLTAGHDRLCQPDVPASVSPQIIDLVEAQTRRIKRVSDEIAGLT